MLCADIIRALDVIVSDELMVLFQVNLWSCLC
jgi:hypothetical protein